MMTIRVAAVSEALGGVPLVVAEDSPKNSGSMRVFDAFVDGRAGNRNRLGIVFSGPTSACSPGGNLKVWVEHGRLVKVAGYCRKSGDSGLVAFVVPRKSIVSSLRDAILENADVAPLLFSIVSRGGKFGVKTMSDAVNFMKTSGLGERWSVEDRRNVATFAERRHRTHAEAYDEQLFSEEDSVFFLSVDKLLLAASTKEASGGVWKTKFRGKSYYVFSSSSPFLESGAEIIAEHAPDSSDVSGHCLPHRTRCSEHDEGFLR